MMTLALYFLQVFEPAEIAAANDVWSVLREVGGAAGILFGIVVIVLYRDNKICERKIEELNKQGREDAKEGVRLMTSVENLIDAMLDKYEHGERRIVQSVEREARSIREELNVYKQQLKEKAVVPDGANSKIDA